MGNTITKEECVVVDDIADLLKDNSYTIKRTSGEWEDQWKIGLGIGYPKWITQTASNKMGDWRIFMHNNKGEDPNLYVGGWRRLETIYPTSLKGNEEAINTWRKSISSQLDSLEEQRRAIKN
jgi:hypothetical protein